MKFEERQQINRSPSDVFLGLSRPDLYLSTWSRGVLSATEVPGEKPATTTAVYKIVGRDLIGKAHWRYEVTSSEPGKAFSARATGGPVPFIDSFTLRPLEDGGTEVVHVQEILPKGVFTLLGPVFPIVWPTLVRHNLSRFKAVMEKRKSPIPSLAVTS
jgi:Polyketide cyclase / dehydrase and lipid transport